MSVFTWMPWYFVPMMVLGLAIPIVVLTRLLRGSAERSRILSRGLPGQASIVNIWETGVRVNDSPQVGFQLHVYPQGGQPYAAQTTMIVSQLAIPRIQPGSTVQVMIDPADPSKVAIVL
ncbi:MAG: DUF3592 domain-containing protein [Nannocystaceae bacterium]|nr:DUF3592 domain-containing protein [Nannocystaceae bacterium]